MGPCHHGMVLSQVADGETASIIEAAASKLNRERRTRGGPPAGIDGGGNNCYNLRTGLITKRNHVPRDWTNPLV